MAWFLHAQCPLLFACILPLYLSAATRPHTHTNTYLQQYLKTESKNCNYCKPYDWNWLFINRNLGLWYRLLYLITNHLLLNKFLTKKKYYCYSGFHLSLISLHIKEVAFFICNDYIPRQIKRTALISFQKR